MTTPRRPPFPRLKTDQEAAEFWSRHDSAAHARNLPEVSVAVAPPLRRRGVARACAKQAVTVRLDPAQVTALKRLARRRGVPSEDLLRAWIAAGLAKERAG